MKSNEPLHLVLGASRGIGLAFAEELARRQQSLFVVARSRSGLNAAAEELRRIGSPHVEVSATDVLTKSFDRLLSSLTPRCIRSVFVGGPSPPAGTQDAVSIDKLRFAERILLDYPFRVARWAIAQPSRPDLVLLSSSTALEDASSHAFFLSALLRPVSERLVKVACAGRKNSAIILRPKVVLTDLAVRFANGLDGALGDTPQERLQRFFGLRRVPTPIEYVRLNCKRAIMTCTSEKEVQ